MTSSYIVSNKSLILLVEKSNGNIAVFEIIITHFYFFSKEILGTAILCIENATNK